MNRQIFAIILNLFAGYAWSAELTASQLAEMMSRARFSEGFEARMNVTALKPGAQKVIPLKLSVIGQVNADRQLLLIRGISPEPVHNRIVEASRNKGARIKAIEYNSTEQKVKAYEPFARLYNSGLVVWDMFAPWWTWPKQVGGDIRNIAGKACTVVHSSPDQDSEGANRIGEVESCINLESRLSLKTEIFDKRHHLVRTLTVDQMMRKGNGFMAAKKFIVTESDRTVTEIEIYAGDEEYQLLPDTFSRLDAYTADGR
jgi:hypothetical protein